MTKGDNVIIHIMGFNEARKHIYNYKGRKFILKLLDLHMQLDHKNEEVKSPSKKHKVEIERTLFFIEVAFPENFC